MNATHTPRQTTVLIGGSNGNASLCAILGDHTNAANAGHTIRVCTRNPKRFTDEKSGAPRSWRCNEQKAFDLFPWEVLPSSWITHVGAPDCVIGYASDDNHTSDEMTNMERAISGIGTGDDGGQADLIMLCCPVGAHLDILRRVARALYRLNERGVLIKGAPPLVIGTLYGGGGFDWMSRIAFAKERPSSFGGKWDRELALFALKAFPYLCKSTQIGTVTMYGRYPQLLGAICPNSPRVRAHAKIVLEKLLQSKETGKYLDFLGISCKEKLGGDGSAVLADAAQTAAYVAVRKAANGGKKEGSTPGGSVGVPSSMVASGDAFAQPAHNIFSMPMADHADPHSSLGFLTCTINCTNQFLHPGICSHLFHDPSNPAVSDIDGTVPWDASKKKNPIPRFYGDGGAILEAGILMMNMGTIESYPIMACLDQMFAPAGMQPICSQHGGEPLGRLIFNMLNNHPKEVGERSGLVEMAMKLQELKLQGINNISADNYSLPNKDDRIKCAGFLAWSLSTGLSKNSRVGSVLAPVIVVPNDDPTDKVTRRIRPNVNTRFFTDDVPHGLCILLGIGELLGFNLERDMSSILKTVRRLQRWMGKEYVLPKGAISSGSKIVADAKDIFETSAPQAFGVNSIPEFQMFLKLSPFGENWIDRSEKNMFKSPMFSAMHNQKRTNHPSKL